jgi:ElaB/YqjD/DUF883 family membrane-anchored ribosome-binding protein
MADTRDQHNKGQSASESARQTAQEAKNKIQEGAQNAGHRLQEGAQNVGHRVQETASQVGHRAQEFATGLEEKTHQAASSVGQRLSSLAGTIQSSAPREGIIGSAASGVAQSLETSGRYLQDNRLGDMAEDIGAVIKSYPFTAMGICFGLGLLLGMSSRR